MVKAEVKTPNKRKSILHETPAKKQKVENGKSNDKSPIVKIENQSPKNNLQIQKSNKKNKQNKGNSEAQSPKDIKPFKGTKQVFQGGEKPKKEIKQKDIQNKAIEQTQTAKKKRRNALSGLAAEVYSQKGSKDPEILKKLNEKIDAISSREELSKTAKKKLGFLRKLKQICEDGKQGLSVGANSKANESKKTAQTKAKAEKKDSAPQAAQQKKKQAALVKKAVKEEDNSDDEDEEDSDAEESGEEEEDSDGEAEGEEVEGDDDQEEDDDEEEDDDDEEDDDEEDDDSDEEEAPAPKGKSSIKTETKTEKNASKNKQDVNQQEPNTKQLSLEDLKSRDILKKGQKRFVLFIGNIPYDTTKEDLAQHFSKVGEIIDIRIPTIKGSNKPRGFGYIEVSDETAYEKCLSMHHSQLKGRRLNVLYTQGGKKKGDDKKKQIKAKNMKLHALRKQGKLAGSVKETQKRSFRRNKKKNSNQKTEES